MRESRESVLARARALESSGQVALARSLLASIGVMPIRRGGLVTRRDMDPGIARAFRAQK